MRSQERAARAAHARALATEDTDDPRSRSPSVVTLRPSDAELGLDTWMREQGLDADDDDVERQRRRWLAAARDLIRQRRELQEQAARGSERHQRQLVERHQWELNQAANAGYYIRGYGKGKGHAATARAAHEAVDAARAAQRSEQPPQGAGAEEALAAPVLWRGVTPGGVRLVARRWRQPLVDGLDWSREPLAPSDVQRLEDAARAAAESFPPGAPLDATAAAWVWMTAYGVLWREMAGLPAAPPPVPTLRREPSLSSSSDGWLSAGDD